MKKIRSDRFVSSEGGTGPCDQIEWHPVIIAALEYAARKKDEENGRDAEPRN